MLRPRRLYKIRAVGLQTDKAGFISCIHQLGFLHVRDLTEEVKSKQIQLHQDVPLKQIEEISEIMLRAQFAAEVFNTRLKKKLPSVALPETVSVDSAVSDAKIALESCESKIVKLNAELVELDTALEQARIQKDFFDGAFTFESEKSVLLCGRVLKKDFDDAKLPKEVKQHAVVSVRDVSKDTYAISVLCAKQKQELVLKTFKLLNVDWKPLAFGAKKSIEELEEEKANVVQALEVVYSDEGTHVAKAYALAEIAKQRCELPFLFASSKKIFYVEAFIPRRQLPQLKAALEGKNVILESVVPHTAPILMHELPYVGSFNIVTQLFGFPNYNGIDPTFFLSLFFPFFFGFMLSDAGYGFIVLLAALAFFMMRKRNPVFKDVAVITAASGVWTVIIGAMLGSWFGNLFGIVPLWGDAFKESFTLLLFSIGVGLIHINVGIALSLATNILNRDYKKIVLENVSLWVVQLAILFFILKMSFVGAAALVLGAGLLIVKSSAMGLMELTGFAGNVLSYARLLALDLATGGIALAINIMGEQLGAAGVIGVIFAPIILIVGHVFNLIINVVGSVIHSARLHFLEFFSLFFGEAGEKFEPFKMRNMEGYIWKHKD